MPTNFLQAGMQTSGAVPIQGINPAEQPQQPLHEPEQTEDLGNLNKFLEQVNIAEKLDDETLDKMGEAVYNGYELDIQSRGNWDELLNDWVKLAAQIKEQKTFPWPNASNIKYPLLSTAAMQFAARAYPSLVPADGKIVQFKVVGIDPQGKKAEQADRLAKHMNYQLLVDMGDWEEEMDHLLMQLPIVGCLFKKTYFDPIRKTNASKLIGPKDLVVNYWATSLETAHRKTEIIPMTKNEIRSYQNAGVFLEDVELPALDANPKLPSKADVHGSTSPSKVDEATPYVILEQHTFWDIDDDGYAEPYIITIEERSKKVLRVVARFDSDGIITNDDNEIVRIDPVEYYTKFGFIPNPDGGFYDIGFGHLLGPMNESVNTLINQLIDSGTLYTLQSGFLGKGLRLKMGEQRLQPGEWRVINSTGDDLKKQVLPLPTREPSEVLLKLLGMLVESGNKLASIAEIFTGKMPGQNTPATTTQATIEQGMKVFTAIYKRVYRALTKEFKKLFRLNSLYDENFLKAQKILDEPISRQDYDIKTYDVSPTSDPTAISTTQKMMKAQQLVELLPLGTLNPMEVTKRVLEAQEQPKLETLVLQEQQQQPDPKVMQMQAKMQMESEKHKLDMQKAQFEMQKIQAEAQMDLKAREMDQKMDAMARQIELRLKAVEAQQDAKHSQAKHQLAIKQTMEKAYAQRHAREVAGVENESRNSGVRGKRPRKNRRGQGSAS